MQSRIKLKELQSCLPYAEYGIRSAERNTSAFGQIITGFYGFMFGTALPAHRRTIISVHIILLSV